MTKAAYIILAVSIIVVAVLVSVVVVVSGHPGGVSSASYSQVTAELQRLQAQEAELEQATQQEKSAVQSANLAHLGVCFSMQTDTSTGDVSDVLVQPVTDSGGVYTCNNGGEFVSVVPQPPSTSGAGAEPAAG
jgi:outer membrane murein-binding lipoprotein Lpp